MTRFKNFEVENAILCEDIRQEVNNKKTLVGVYAGDILISSLPAPIDLAFYLDGKAFDRELFRIEVRLSGPGKSKAIAMLELGATGESLGIAMITPRMQVLFEREGMFKIAIRDPDQSWKTIISKRVILRPELASG